MDNNKKRKKEDRRKILNADITHLQVENSGVVNQVIGYVDKCTLCNT
jgi:hypothetical protein